MTPKRNLDFSKEVVNSIDPPPEILKTGPATADEAPKIDLERRLSNLVADDSPSELVNLRTIIVSLVAKLKV